jgi:O-antigen/teichoic acid export membrane protein
MKVDLTSAQHWTNLTLGRTKPVSDGQRRYVRIFQAVLTSLAGRGVGVIVSLISIPLTVRYLGAERYGVWVTVSTLLAWLNIADLGLGSGLTNALSECYGKDRRDLAQSYVATTFWVLVGVGGALGGAFLITWPWLDWPALFNVHSAQARAEVGPAMALAIAIFLLNFPLSIVVKIYGAYQEGAIANSWATAGNLASLLALIAATRVEGGLVWLVVAVSGTLLLVTAANALWLFWRHKPWLKPRVSAIRRESVRRLVGTGGMFFVLQIASLLILQTDNVIIAHYLGARQVTPYSVAWRLFSYSTLPQVLIFNALWPAYGEAFTRRDTAWIKRTLRANALFSIVSTALLAAPLVLFGQIIIELWAGGDAVPPFTVLAWMGCWSLLFAAMNTTTCILNGLGRVRGQMIYGMATAGVNIVLTIAWVSSFGLSGVIAGTVISYLVCALVPQLAETIAVIRSLSPNERSESMRRD